MKFLKTPLSQLSKILTRFFSKDNFLKFYNKIKSIFDSCLKRVQFNYHEIISSVKEDNHYRKFKKLPWYLVLGTQGAGKNNIIKNTGLDFIDPKYFCEEAVKYIKQLPYCKWWFSEQAVMIDLMQYDKQKDVQTRKQLNYLLKKIRKQKPINGILLTVTLTDLVMLSNGERQDYIQDICQFMRDIYATFKCRIPVYLIFNKCDLIAGFSEFFSDLSKEELRQIWGVTFPIENCHDNQFVSLFFEREYEKLIEHLNRRVLWAISTESELRGRELIHEFPQQMQLLKKPILNFITELFGAIRYPDALQFRGVYFTSCEQSEGEIQNFLLQAISKKFQLIPPVTRRQSRHSECYFMRSLFFNTIYPESALLGDSEKAIKNKKRLRRISALGLPLLVILSAFMFHDAYTQNKRLINLTNNKIDYYDEALHAIDDKNNLPETVLPALDQIYQSYMSYEKANSASLNSLFMTFYIKNHLYQSLQRNLKSLFLPRIAGDLQNQLTENITDTNYKYALLKAYLAFSDDAHIDSQFIKVPMKLKWDKQYNKQIKLNKKLNQYLKLSLLNEPEKLPLDNILINKVRGELETRKPATRAYGLLQLKSNLDTVPALPMTILAGHRFDQVFVASSGDLTIPPLYTEKGYEKVFKKFHSKLASNVEKDNHDIGLSHDVTESQAAIDIAVRQQYQAKYINAWQNNLNSIQVKKVSSIAQLINQINILTDSHSPLSNLLNVVYENTSTIDDDVNVKQHFNAVNSFTKNKGQSASLNDLIAQLIQVKKLLVKIQSSPDINQACFHEVKSAMAGDDNPIFKLKLLSHQAPSPIKQWIVELADNSWQVIITGAHQKMNAIWAQQVIQNYNETIKNRYPIAMRSHTQISITNFEDFFGAKGVLQDYFVHYLKPFINTEKRPWQYYNIHGYDIALNKQLLQLFERTYKIQRDYFATAGLKAKVNFVIEPLTLDGNVASSNLSIGGKHIVYKHGPQAHYAISWPLPVDDQTAKITIDDFNGNQYTQAYNGPWSMFRLLNQGKLSSGTSGKTYYRFSVHDHHGTYKLKGEKILAQLKLTDLKGFYLPNKIAKDGG